MDARNWQPLRESGGQNTGQALHSPWMAERYTKASSCSMFSRKT